MFEKLRAKHIAKQQESDAAVTKRYQALVEEALAGQLGDDDKTLARVDGILSAAERSWSDLEGDIESLRQRQQLEAVCANEDDVRERLSAARQRKRDLGAAWEVRQREHAEAMREVERDIGRAQSESSTINQAKAQLAKDYPDSPVVQRENAARAAEQGAARAEQLEREIAEIDARLKDDAEFLESIGKDDGRVEGVERRGEALSERRASIVKELEAEQVPA